MHKAVAPTLSAKSFTALAAAPLFHCFQKAFIRVHPFLGRGCAKKMFSRPGLLCTRCGFYFDNKNAPAQIRQRREFLVCRNDGALAAGRGCQPLPHRRTVIKKSRCMKERIIFHNGVGFLLALTTFFLASVSTVYPIIMKGVSAEFEKIVMNL